MRISTVQKGAHMVRNELIEMACKQTRRAVIGLRLQVIVSAALLVSSMWAVRHAHAELYYAFGQQEIALPKNSAPGVVVAREYYTPMQLCGRPVCNVVAIANFISGSGGVKVPGPIVQTKVSGISTRILIDGQEYQSQVFRNGSYDGLTMTRGVEVQLLSDGRPNTGGVLGELNQWSSYSAISVDPGKPSSPNNYWQYFNLIARVIPIDGTCSVPNQTVTLAPAMLKKFGDVGSTVGTTGFQIRVNSCPKGYNRVGYSLFPVGGTIANAPGVLPLGTGSTAKGVQIRVENPSGTPAAFQISSSVPGYNKATGGSYLIPLQASYIKTGPAVEIGDVKGAMTVLLDYQ